MEHGTDLLSSIGLCITAAAALAYLAHQVRQPLILAYLVAGLVIGPEVGLGWVSDRESIRTASGIGLILLLFIIGLEMDLKKLLAAGRPVLVTGILQFLLCTLMGFGFFALLGFPFRGGDFSLYYLALCASLSSTMIVVKLLYDKFELATLPGRITLGVLVFQDIWAIIVLAVQPSFQNPQVGPLLASLGKGVLLVVLTLAVSKYVLPPVYRSIAKSPELVLVASLAWCFAVCAGASYVGLSREMGALIAGISISTFPYNMDVIAKVVSIRDFFVTLFFVALGMQIPMPSARILALAVGASAFLMVSRLLVVFPILMMLRMGHRASLLPSINLAQISEFSMVIATIGLGYKHIGADVVSVIIFVFAFTSTASVYLVANNHSIAEYLSRMLKRCGIKDLDADGAGEETPSKIAEKDIVLLGFFREASSLVHEFELKETGRGRHPLLDNLLIIDFNPEVYAELNRRGIACLYGDIANMETLRHAHIQHAELVICTIPDHILKGTTNSRMLKQARQICPSAEVIVTADRINQALELYDEGADFVFIPRLHSTADLAKVIESGLREGFKALKTQHISDLRRRDEVLE